MLGQFDHVAAGDTADRATTPCGQHQPVEDALGRPCGAVPVLGVGVLVKKLRDCDLDTMPPATTTGTTPLPPCRSLRNRADVAA